MTRTLSPGLCTRDLEDKSTLVEKILEIREREFDHCHMSSLPGEETNLDTLRAAAEDSGVTLSVGIGQINPSRPHRAATALALGNGNLLNGLRRMLDRTKKLAATQAHFTIGTLEDRAAKDITWSEQLCRAEDLVQALTIHAADLDIDLVLKTHEEMTTFELDNLLTNIRSSRLGTAFSPVNVLLRLEHPMYALSRLAPHLKAVIADDAVLHWNHRGIQRALVPFGHGDIPWSEILVAVKAGSRLGPLPVILDVHRAELETPAFESTSTANHTDSTPRELAELQRLIRPGRPTAPPSTRSRFNEGSQRVLTYVRALEPTRSLLAGMNGA